MYVCTWSICSIGALRSPDGGVGRAGAVLVQLVSLVVLLAYLCEVMHTQATQLLCDGSLTLSHTQTPMLTSRADCTEHNPTGMKWVGVYRRSNTTRVWRAQCFPLSICWLEAVWVKRSLLQLKKIFVFIYRHKHRSVFADKVHIYGLIVHIATTESVLATFDWKQL